MTDVEQCCSELKTFVESDEFLGNDEKFLKLLNEYEQALIQLLDNISFLTSILN